MEEISQKYQLSENGYILTQDPSLHYRLEEGSVRVYIVPVSNGRHGQPKLYCRISNLEDRRAIPSLDYRDETGTRWCFLIVSDSKSTVLSCSSRKTTNVIYINFLNRLHLPGNDLPSLEKSMVAFYHNTCILSAKDDSPYLCENSEDIYRLISGEISVSIVPLENGYPGTPQHCCDLKATDRQQPVFPSLVCMDRNQCLWFFQIRSKSSSAVLTRMRSNTLPKVQKEFLESLGVDTQGAYPYEERLLDYYANQYREQNKVILSGSDYYIVPNAADAYSVEDGSVFVYIAPVNNGHPKNPLNYCDISASDNDTTIPGFVYEDPAHTKWRLIIKAKSEQAVVKPLFRGNAASLQKIFLERRQIQTIDQEGFENSLVDYYVKKVKLADRVYIDKATRADREAQKDVHNILADAFSNDGQTEHTKHLNYQALQFVCNKLDIPLMKSEDLFTRCGKESDVKKLAQASNMICRKVVLDADWYEYDCGGFIGTLDEEIIGCAPDKKGNYLVYHTSDEQVEKLTPQLAVQISPEVYSLGRTLPSKPLSRKDVYAFCKKSIKSRDLTPYIILVIICALIGILLPTLNRMIYDDYIPIGNIGNLTELCLVMLTFMIGNLSFSIVKNLFGYRITSRVGIDLQNAVYHRLFHLPESFFRRFDSADLAGRVSCVGAIASRYANTLVLSSISALFSIFYLVRMFTYNVKLTWLGIAIYGVYLFIIVGITSTARKAQYRIAEAESEYSGKLFQYLNGVDKIRMAGVEERALASFMRPYAKAQYEEIQVNRLVSIEEALTTIVQYLFSMVLYWYIVKKLQISTFSVGTFAAFTSAFGSFTGALGSFVDEALLLYQERKELKRYWDVFDAVPEDDDSKKIPDTLSGSLSLENVTFAYTPEGSTVLDHLSLDVHPGEYIGIVGPSGCGKSTLLKLILGFETPQSGHVLVDHADLSSINKAAYRQQLGVVLQNGKLISGSIYENITITAPEADMKRVTEVVEQVGLKEDIKQMPMGLHTMLSENSNTISGGQQQRILIARAICGNPRILIFDEATSALDNLTQATVSASLDKMHVTRIVVAHRLSTIKNCDRILVMDNGKIVQQGNYETLMKQTDGLFYALASRQITQ